MITFWLQLIVSYHFSQHSSTLCFYLEGIFTSSRIRENPLLNCPRPQQNRFKVLLQRCLTLSKWKKEYSGPRSAVNWYAFISLWLLFGFEQLCVSSDSFLQLVVWSQQKNYQENTFCQLAVPRVHKQDHLAIISCQSRKGKRMFIRGKKCGRQCERRKKTQVDKKRWMGKGGGGLLEPWRGHHVPAERNSRKHP